MNIAVDSKHVVTNFSKARRAYTTNVAKTHHDYVLLTAHLIRPASHWGSLSWGFHH